MPFAIITVRDYVYIYGIDGCGTLTESRHRHPTADNGKGVYSVTTLTEGQPPHPTADNGRGLQRLLL